MRSTRQYCRQPSFDFVCADLSFISLTLVLPALALFIARDALLLVKPQFELSPPQVGKGGIVGDPSLHALVEAAHPRGLRQQRASRGRTSSTAPSPAATATANSSCTLVPTALAIHTVTNP